MRWKCLSNSPADGKTVRRLCLHASRCVTAMLSPEPRVALVRCVLWVSVLPTMWGSPFSDSGEALVLMLSLWMLGAVPVPIELRSKANERELLVREFDLIAILEDQSRAEMPRYASILVSDTWTKSIAKHGDAPLFESPPAPALISLTSGTTGRALGIVLSHKQLLFRLKSNLQLGRRRPGGCLLNPIPVSGSSPRNHSLSQLFDGGTIVFHPPLFSAGELADAVWSRAATSLCLVPTILREFSESIDAATRPYLTISI